MNQEIDLTIDSLFLRDIQPTSMPEQEYHYSIDHEETLRIKSQETIIYEMMAAHIRSRGLKFNEILNPFCDQYISASKTRFTILVDSNYYENYFNTQCCHRCGIDIRNNVDYLAYEDELCIDCSESLIRDTANHVSDDRMMIFG